jgi:hypothetical protein
MGLYRSVYTELPCASCGVVRRVEVQFKTGDDGLEHYEAGDIAAEDDTFKRGCMYEGIADRYCESCYRRWAGDSAEAQSAVVANCVESGRLEMINRDTGPVTAERIREQGEERARQLRVGTAQGGPYVINFGHRDIEVHWDGRRAEVWNDASAALTEFVRRQVDDELLHAGWDGGDQQFRVDLHVYLDDEQCIRVRIVTDNEPHHP